MNETNLILLAVALVITFTILEIAIIVCIVKIGPSANEESPDGCLPADDWQQSYYSDTLPFGRSWNPMLQSPYPQFLHGSTWRKS